MDVLIILIAAFGAGVLNTIAGGGTFLTFPALVFVGMPPVIANATSAVAVFPGYLSGALGFRDELRQFNRRQMGKLLAVTFVGGLVGALLLLVSSDKAFSAVVPFLLLAATLAFLFGDQIRTWAARHSGGVTPYGTMGLFAVSVYGGYFNGGIGIILLSLLSGLGYRDMLVMNGLKNVLSALLSLVAAGTFIAAGLISWEHALPMAIASA